MTKAELMRIAEQEMGTKPPATATKADLAALLENHRKARFLGDLARARTAQTRLFGK